MKKNAGFTLIELLVGVAIFAILSAMGWKVFDYIYKVKQQNTQHELRLTALQQAYQQILRDSLQIVPLVASQNMQLEPALHLGNGRLAFSKVGVTDPLQQGIPPTERIEYQYRADEKKLYRLKYAGIHQTGREQPLSSVILSDVEQFSILILNPEPQNTWPLGQENQRDPTVLKILPKGMHIKLMVNNVEYEWVFTLLNTDYMSDTLESENNPFIETSNTS